MPSHSPMSPGQPSAALPDRPEGSTQQSKAQRHRHHRLINLAYVLGLLLVFALSLLLLPDDTGLGKLLWSERDGGSHTTQ